MLEETNPPFVPPVVSSGTVTAKTNTVEVSTSKPNEESHYKGISIKAYLALLVVGTLCFIECSLCLFCLWRKIEYTPNNQLYIIASSILAYYFSKAGLPTQSPSTTTTTSSSENKTP